ncbi:MAG: dihydrodipicolinate synthase family protein [Firmicutes bacterium]|jgi:4-hydroxy-tetrahydrodipicolinate synthase|nr:dihydrodipicolinate synthase family protein [Bacillota bacterium]
MTLPPGVYTILPTPFADDGRLDLASLERVVEFALAAGVHGLTILGILGEAHKLGEDERRQVVDTVVRRTAGRVPVVVGASAPATDLAIRYGQEAQALGATALMVAPPVNLRSLDAVREYYRRVHDATQAPLVVQDEPVFSGVVMPAAFLAALTDDLPRARAIKLEELPSPLKVAQVLAAARQPVAVYGGMGGVYFYEELVRGAAGTMTGFAFPEVLVAIYTAYTAGDRAGARAIFYRYLPLIRYEGQPGIGLALRKELLRRRGVIASAAIRHPGPVLDPGSRAELDELLRVLDLAGAGTAPVAVGAVAARP